MAKRRLTPRDIRIAYLSWQGMDEFEIGAEMGISDKTVSQVLNSKPVRDYIERIGDRTIDTMVDIQADLQAAAPIAMHTEISLLQSSNPAIRHGAAKTILEMAGHTPIKHIAVEKLDSLPHKYDGMSEEEIKRKMIEEIKGNNSNSETVH